MFYCILFLLTSFIYYDPNLFGTKVKIAWVKTLAKLSAIQLLRYVFLHLQKKSIGSSFIDVFPQYKYSLHDRYGT